MTNATNEPGQPVSPSRSKSNRDELGVGRVGFEEWLTTALWDRVVLIELNNGLIEGDAAMIWMTGPHTVGFARREETLAAIGKVTQTRERGILTEDEFREERR